MHPHTIQPDSNIMTPYPENTAWSLFSSLFHGFALGSQQSQCFHPQLSPIISEVTSPASPSYLFPLSSVSKNPLSSTHPIFIQSLLPWPEMFPPVNPYFLLMLSVLSRHIYKCPPMLEQPTFPHTALPLMSYPFPFSRYFIFITYVLKCWLPVLPAEMLLPQV